MALRKGRSKAAKRAFDCAKLIKKGEQKRALRLATKRGIDIAWVRLTKTKDELMRRGYLFVQEVNSDCFNGFLLAKIR